MKIYPIFALLRIGPGVQGDQLLRVPKLQLPFSHQLLKEFTIPTRELQLWFATPWAPPHLEYQLPHVHVVFVMYVHVCVET